MKAWRLDRLRFGLLVVSVVALAGCDALDIHDTESLLVPTLMRSEVVGLVAGLGTTFASLPDLVSMMRKRSCAGMSPRMAAIMGVFQIGWVYYGLLIVSRPVIVWNMIAIVINGLSVGAHFYFTHKERRQARP